MDLTPNDAIDHPSIVHQLQNTREENAYGTVYGELTNKMLNGMTDNIYAGIYVTSEFEFGGDYKRTMFRELSRTTYDYIDEAVYFKSFGLLGLPTVQKDDQIRTDPKTKSQKFRSDDQNNMRVHHFGKNYLGFPRGFQHEKIIKQGAGGKYKVKASIIEFTVYYTPSTRALSYSAKTSVYFTDVLDETGVYISIPLEANGTERYNLFEVHHHFYVTQNDRDSTDKLYGFQSKDNNRMDFNRTYYEWYRIEAIHGDTTDTKNITHGKYKKIEKIEDGTILLKEIIRLRTINDDDESTRVQSPLLFGLYSTTSQSVKPVNVMTILLRMEVSDVIHTYDTVGTRVFPYLQSTNPTAIIGPFGIYFDGSPDKKWTNDVKSILPKSFVDSMATQAKTRAFVRGFSCIPFTKDPSFITYLDEYKSTIIGPNDQHSMPAYNSKRKDTSARWEYSVCDYLLNDHFDWYGYTAEIPTLELLLAKEKVFRHNIIQVAPESIRYADIDASLDYKLKFEDQQNIKSVDDTITSCIARLQREWISIWKELHARYEVEKEHIYTIIMRLWKRMHEILGDHIGPWLIRRYFSFDKKERWSRDILRPLPNGTYVLNASQDMITKHDILSYEPLTIRTHYLDPYLKIQRSDNFTETSCSDEDVLLIGYCGNLDGLQERTIHHEMFDGNAFKLTFNDLEVGKSIGSEVLSKFSQISIYIQPSGGGSSAISHDGDRTHRLELRINVQESTRIDDNMEIFRVRRSLDSKTNEYVFDVIIYEKNRKNITIVGGGGGGSDDGNRMEFIEQKDKNLIATFRASTTELQVSIVKLLPIQYFENSEYQNTNYQHRSLVRMFYIRSKMSLNPIDIDSPNARIHSLEQLNKSIANQITKGSQKIQIDEFEYYYTLMNAKIQNNIITNDNIQHWLRGDAFCWKRRSFYVRPKKTNMIYYVTLRKQKIVDILVKNVKFNEIQINHRAPMRESSNLLFRLDWKESSLGDIKICGTPNDYNNNPIRLFILFPVDALVKNAGYAEKDLPYLFMQYVYNHIQLPSVPEFYSEMKVECFEILEELDRLLDLYHQYFNQSTIYKSSPPTLETLKSTLYHVFGKAEKWNRTLVSKKLLSKARVQLDTSLGVTDTLTRTYRIDRLLPTKDTLKKYQTHEYQ